MIIFGSFTTLIVASVANIVEPLAMNATFFVPLPVTATAPVIPTVLETGPLVDIPRKRDTVVVGDVSFVSGFARFETSFAFGVVKVEGSPGGAVNDAATLSKSDQKAVEVSGC